MDSCRTDQLLVKGIIADSLERMGYSPPPKAKDGYDNLEVIVNFISEAWNLIKGARHCYSERGRPAKLLGGLLSAAKSRMTSCLLPRTTSLTPCMPVFYLDKCSRLDFTKSGGLLEADASQLQNANEVYESREDFHYAPSNDKKRVLGASSGAIV